VGDDGPSAKVSSQSAAAAAAAATRPASVQHQRPLHLGIFLRSTDRRISNDANFVAEHGRKTLVVFTVPSPTRKAGPTPTSAGGIVEPGKWTPQILLFSEKIVRSRCDFYTAKR
jgi:hypothetical protein